MAMDDKNFKIYLHQLEQHVIVPGILVNQFTKNRMVSAKNGRLEVTEFGKLIGAQFDCQVVCAIDYYGLVKKSSAFASSYMNQNGILVKAVEVPVVYFASLKIEHVSQFCDQLVKDFPRFKKQMLEARGFIPSRNAIGRK
jgi:hypothetical protein